MKTGEMYYRARIINLEHYHSSKSEETGIGITKDGQLLGYNEFNSREPVLGISGEGRNNIAGASYLYVASDERTACMKVKSQFGDLISLATFKVVEPLKIIDFASDKTFKSKESNDRNMSMVVFFTLLMSSYCTPLKNENQYRATQVISDYLRKTGIDGIAYQSFLSPGGINYTIFNSHPGKIKFLESKILLHKQANHSFWDFNKKTEVMSNKNGYLLEYNKDIVQKHMEDFRRSFKEVTNNTGN